MIENAEQYEITKRRLTDLESELINLTVVIEELRAELEEYEAGVSQACAIPPNQNQFDALVCFAFNTNLAFFHSFKKC